MQPTISSDVTVFGAGNNESNYLGIALDGVFVRVTLTTVLGGTACPVIKPLIGRVVGCRGSDIVISTPWGYVGWISPADYEIANFHPGNPDLIH